MSKDKSLLQEKLTGLYLRLNGYFQTGYIPHSRVSGQIGTDVDRLAIRFPKHSQPERGVADCSALRIPPETIDIILAEVKNSTLIFNRAIKSLGIRADENWEQLLRWCGLFEQDEIQVLVPKLKLIVDNDGQIVIDDFEYITHSNNFGEISIRPILFSIESAHNPGDNKIWINGEDMINHIWECFCPAFLRPDCETRYPIDSWGTEYSKIVQFFKDRNRRHRGKPTTAELYTHFNL